MKQRDVPTSRLQIVSDSDTRLVIIRKPDLKIAALLLLITALGLHIGAWVTAAKNPWQNGAPSWELSIAGWGLILGFTVALMRAGIRLVIDPTQNTMTLTRGILLRRPMIVPCDSDAAFELRRDIFQSEADYQLKQGIPVLVWTLRPPSTMAGMPRRIQLDKGADASAIRRTAQRVADVSGIPLTDFAALEPVTAEGENIAVAPDDIDETEHIDPATEPAIH